MRYRLRTLLIVLAVGPVVLAGAWFVGKPIVTSYLAQQQDSVWIDAGPEVIEEFSVGCDFGAADAQTVSPDEN